MVSLARAAAAWALILVGQFAYRPSLITSNGVRRRKPSVARLIRSHEVAAIEFDALTQVTDLVLDTGKLVRLS